MSDNNPNIDRIRAAAEAGDAKAQFQLAICYMKGAGVPRDFAQGVVWIRKAAEKKGRETSSGLPRPPSRGIRTPSGAWRRSPWPPTGKREAKRRKRER